MSDGSSSARHVSRWIWPEDMPPWANSSRKTMGWISVAGMLLFAYSHGGGTYTGLEAVSNNVHTLAEPRVQTGKWTMAYMAVSLAFPVVGS